MKQLFVTCVVALGAAAIGCGGGSAGQATVEGSATLTGLSEHSAIVISLVGPVTRVANAEADGTYAFEGLPAGSYAVTASAPSTFEGAITVPVTAPAEGSANAPAVHLSPYGEITGTISGASPGTTVVVAGTSASAATDAAGAFRISAVPVGTHTLVASDGDKRGSSAGITVAYAQTATAPAFELSPPSGSGSLSGAVALGAEADRSGVVVSLSGPVQGAALTGADGSYSFTGLPAGEYLLMLSAPSTAEGTQTQRVTVAGATTAASVTFAPLGTLTGTANLNGATTGNAGILVFIPGYATFTDGAGAWTLRGVPVGTYDVQAFRDGYTTALATAQVVRYARSTAVANLALAADGGDAEVTIASSVRLPATSDHSGITVTLDGDRSASTDATGAFSLPGVPSGIHSLALDHGGLYHRDLDAVVVLPTSELLIIDTSTVPAQLLPFHGLVLSLGVQAAAVPGPTAPAASDGGRYVLFLGEFNGNWGPLYLTDTTTGVTRKVVDRAVPDTYRFSEDGEHFVFAHELNGTTATLAVGASATGVVTELSNVASAYAVQEVAGGRLLFVQYPLEFGPISGQEIGMLTSVRWDGSDRIELGDTVYTRTPNAFWVEPTRTRVALWDYFVGGNVSSIGIDGNDRQELVPAAWSVEWLGGNTLGIWSGGAPMYMGDFSLANLTTRSFGYAAQNAMYPQHVVEVPGHPHHKLALTASAPGGTYLAFMIDLRDSTALEFASNVTDASRISFQGDWAAALYDDDDSLGTSSLKLLNFVALLNQPIGTGLQRQVVFSGDGTKVAYSDEDKIYVATVGSSAAPAELTFEAPVQYSLSQDGAYLLTSSMNGSDIELNLARVGGSTLQLVPASPEAIAEFHGNHVVYYFYDSSGVRHQRAIRLGSMVPVNLSEGGLVGLLWAGTTLMVVDQAEPGTSIGTLKLFSAVDDSVTTLISGVDAGTMHQLDATHWVVITGSSELDAYVGTLHVVDTSARTIHQVSELGSAIKTLRVGNQLALIAGDQSSGTLELTSLTGTGRTTLASDVSHCIAAPSQTSLTCLTLGAEPAVEWIPLDGSPRRTLVEGVSPATSLYLVPDTILLDLWGYTPEGRTELTVANVETGAARGIAEGEIILMELPQALVYLRLPTPNDYGFETGLYVAPRP